MLPYLSCGSEIVHPIVEQSDEQTPNESTANSFTHQDAATNTVGSPLLGHKESDDNFNSPDKNAEVCEDKLIRFLLFFFQ